jgi:hypothetical protein
VDIHDMMHDLRRGRREAKKMHPTGQGANELMSQLIANKPGQINQTISLAITAY